MPPGSLMVPLLVAERARRVLAAHNICAARGRQRQYSVGADRVQACVYLSGRACVCWEGDRAEKEVRCGSKRIAGRDPSG